MELISKPSIATAIIALKDDASFRISDGDPTTEAEYKAKVVFYEDTSADKKIDAPLKWSDVEAKYNELMVAYTNNDYARERVKKYDSVTEQLDKLFHDIDQGKLDKTGSFYTHIQKVKSDAPKE